MAWGDPAPCPYCNAWHWPHCSPLQPFPYPYYSMPYVISPQTGWICSRCGASHAPWVPQCSCKPAETEAPSSLEEKALRCSHIHRPTGSRCTRKLGHKGKHVNDEDEYLAWNY